MSDDEQVYFRTREHPDHPSNPTGKVCDCGKPAFIVTERLVSTDTGLNDVVTGEPLCREHLREALRAEADR